MISQAAVLYKGALAYYRVKKDEDGFTAQLLHYKGHINNTPPKEIFFIKDGRHCTGNTEEQELMDDLYETVKTHFGGLLSRANRYRL